MISSKNMGDKSGRKSFWSHATHPTLWVCQMLLERTDLGLPPELDMQLSPLLCAQKIADWAGVFTREVRFRPGWDRKGGHSCMAELEGMPVLIVSQTNGQYRLYHPFEREGRILTKALRQRLSEYALVFYPDFAKGAESVSAYLLKQLMVFRREWASVVLISSVVGLVALAIPFATNLLFSYVLPSSNIGLLLQLGVGLTVSVLSLFILSLSRGYLLLHIDGKLTVNLFSSLWSRILHLPVTFFERFSSGDLSSRVMSFRESMALAQLHGVSMILNAIFSFFVLSLLFYFQFFVGIYVSLVLVVFCVILLVLSYRSVVLQEKQLDQDGHIRFLTHQLLTGMSKIRLAGAMIRAFNEWMYRFLPFVGLREQERLIQKHFQVLNTLLYPGLLFGVILLAYYSNLHDDAFSLGEFMGTVYAIIFLTSLLSEMVFSLSELVRVIPNLKRLAPFFGDSLEESTFKNRVKTLEGKVTVDRLYMRYPDAKRSVLNGVSFEIGAGEMVAVVGRSGCGKSTLLKMLLGFYPPQSGAIYYDNYALESSCKRDIRKQLGVVLQDDQLVSGDLLSNIVGTSGKPIEAAWQVAELVDLAEDIRAMPMQLHTPVLEEGSTLSGGQRQRLFIARALIESPKYLFFDEATSALDTLTQDKVSKNLAALQVTRLVIAHRLSTIRQADKILVMEDGRIVQTGTFETLSSVDGVFKGLIERQVLD